MMPARQPQLGWSAYEHLESLAYIICMKESTNLYLLRHRYGRTVEMYIAYRTFLHRHVIYGEDKFCKNEEDVRQVTHTLLLSFYSFIYSLFDPSGTNFFTATDEYVPYLKKEVLEIRDELGDLWTKNKSAIATLRSNIGFHGGKHKKGYDSGYTALSKLHPLIPELIMTQLARFFRELDKVVDRTDNYEFHIDPEEGKLLLAHAEKLKEVIESKEMDIVLKGMRKIYDS